MDWLTFIANIVSSVAWPASAVVIALIFRSQLTDLLKRITKGKFAGGEFEFSESAQGQLADAKVDLQTNDAPDDSSEDENELDVAYRLLEISPRAAIIEAWRIITERAQIKIMDEIEDSSESSDFTDSGDLLGRHFPPARMTEYFRKYRILSADEIELFDELRHLRNQAKHVEDFDIGDKKSKEYLILAELLMEHL